MVKWHRRHAIWYSSGVAVRTTCSTHCRSRWTGQPGQWQAFQGLLLQVNFWRGVAGLQWSSWSSFKPHCWCTRPYYPRGHCTCTVGSAQTTHTPPDSTSLGASGWTKISDARVIFLEIVSDKEVPMTPMLWQQISGLVRPCKHSNPSLRGGLKWTLNRISRPDNPCISYYLS